MHSKCGGTECRSADILATSGSEDSNFYRKADLTFYEFSQSPMRYIVNMVYLGYLTFPTVTDADAKIDGISSSN